jgi:superoxide dismutase, Fe-Mn family
MPYEQKNYDHLLGTPGFSDELLKNHFTLYGGYVKNTNALADKLRDGAGTPEWAEMKRRFGWEFNGMRLHELYFGNMSKEEKTFGEDTPLFKKIVEDFGSGKACHEDFLAVGAMRGIGWTILAYDAEGDRLFNTWINEHDVGHLAGAVPLAVMDVFEHAFISDYGLKRADYINAFVKALDWDVVQERFAGAKK